MKTKIFAAMLLPLALSVSACGDTWGQRAATGGAIGAGAGLAVGALAGWPLLGPALVGAAGRCRHRRRHVQGPGQVGRKSDGQPSSSLSFLSNTRSTSSRLSPWASLRGPVVDHVAALRGARHLGDREQRLLGGVAEDREDRHARPEVDGIVAPFTRSYPHAVEIQQPGKFPPVEGDDPAPGLLVGQTVQVAHVLPVNCCRRLTVCQTPSGGL